MPDLASLFSSASPLAGLVPATGAATATATTDTGNTGGFQAMLEQQASQLASNPVVATLLPPLALASAITLGGPAASSDATATGNQTGIAGLPDSGKILPDSLAGLAGADSDQNETPAIDPAVMLMLNGGVQPVLAPSAAPESAPAPAAAAAAAAPAAQLAPTQQAIAQRAAQTAPATLAVSADAAKAATAETTAITIESKDSAAVATPSVELRPVVSQNAAQQHSGGDTQSDAGHNSQSSSSDPQALAATDDAARAAHPPTPGLVEASAGVVQTPLATAATDAPANSIHAVAPTTRTDMADLVDRLVEARQAARMSGPQSVVASVAHSSFGRVTLDFKQDDKGLSVAMTSNDPGFAPAAQAALAQQQQVSATNTGNEAGNSQSNNGSNNQSDPRQTYFAQNNASQSGGQFSGNQSGNGQNAGARWTPEPGIAANPSQPSAQGDTASRENGILA